jgi:hypothetical protein
MVTAQQKTLEHQQSQIEALQKALAEQRARLEQALQENREGNPALLSFRAICLAVKPVSPCSPRLQLSS